MSEVPLRAVALIRMSTAKQVNSPERQRALFAEYCTRHGLQAAGEYDDLATSATHTRLEDRLGIMRMLADAGKDRFDIVWCEEQSRASRDPLEIIPIQRHLSSLGIPLVDYQEDPHQARLSAERELMGTVRAALSRYEVRQLSARVRRSMQQKAAAGRFPGGVCASGLRWDKDRQAFEVEPVGAARALRAFQIFSETRSFYGTAQVLAEEGYVSQRGKAIRANAVTVLIKNPIYRGEFWWGGEKHDIHIPEVVPKALVHKVDAVLALGEGRPQRAAQSASLFSAVLRCPSCGKFLSITKPAKNNPYHNTLTYYTCRRHYDAIRTCDFARAVNEKKLEAAVLPQIAEALREMAQTKKLKVRKPERTKSTKTRAKLEAERQRALDLYIRGQITREEVDKVLERVNTEMAGLEKEVRPLQHITSVQLQAAALAISDLWPTWATRDKRELMLSIIECIVPNPDDYLASQVIWRTG